MNVKMNSDVPAVCEMCWGWTDSSTS
jgi:hypothetical protein